MTKALRGVPESTRPVPSGIIQANGDYFYDDYPPGRAVSTVGLSADTAPDGTTTSAPPGPVDTQERQRILDMFNKP